jgi:hypothetical protein
MNYQETLNEFMQAAEAVKDGNRKALDVYPQLHECMQGLKELQKELKPFLVEERELYDKKEQVIRRGYEITVQARTYYNYKKDARWQMLTEKRKNREALMKKAANSMEELFDEESGEVIPPAGQKASTYPKLTYVGENYE